MKKLLALVLALVMAMSLVTISNADFNDADDISYTEAVEVMNAVGVLAGYDNGDFGPTDTLTRAQAAKIIAYLDLGQKTADAISASGAIFTDVPATTWYAGYVEYCAGAGYVAGVGGGKFAPDEKVTGIQFAKMLLCALGYDAAIEGYTGSDYTLSIARDANKTDLFDGLSIVTSAALTREQAAQMAYNALKATVVEYQGGTNVSTSDGTSVTVNATRNNVYAAAGVSYTTSDDGYQQLCEKLYKNDLKKTGTTTAFGAPAHTWTYKSEKVGTYADTADKVLTGTITKGDLYDAIGEVAMKALGTVVVEEDGKANTAAQTDLTTIAAKGKTANADKLAFTGNGSTTEVYVDYNSATNKYDVSVIVKNVYLAKVSSVTAATASADRYVTVSFKSVTAAYNASSGSQLTTYETESFAKNDYVLVTCAENGSGNFEIKSMTAAPAAVSGKVSSVKGTSNFVMDGVTYKYGAQNAATAPSVNDKIDVYCDANGYVLYTEVTEASAALENYLVVLDEAADLLAGTVKANVLTLDGGIKKSVVLNKLNGTKLTTTGTLTKDKIYSFSVNSDGSYDIDSVAAPYSTSNYTKTGIGYNTGALTYGGTTSAKVNANTVFVVYDRADDSVKTYTGMTEAPKVNYDGDNKADALVKASNGVASAVYLNVRVSGDIVDTSAATEIVYVLGATPVVTKVDNTAIYTFDVIADGEVTTLSTKSTSLLRAVGTWSITQYNGEYVSAASEVGTVAGETVNDYKVYEIDFNGAAADIEFADGLFTLGTYAVLADTDVVAWTINEDGDATETTLSGLDRENSEYEYFVITKKDSSSNLYYVVDAYCQE